MTSATVVCVTSADATVSTSSMLPPVSTVLDARPTGNDLLTSVLRAPEP